MVRAGAVPAVMPFPGEKQHGVKSRVVATAHGSRQDGTLPIGGESQGDASRPGEVGDMVFMQVLEGWGGDGLCSVLGCWLPQARGTGVGVAGRWAPGMVFLWVLLRTSPASPAFFPTALPMWLMLCTHPGIHLGPGT